eukprot:GHVT01061804.1.p1 GENE.GHVT01061804.1~~GHVT01061804.1.p1  ORF type:complete len:103 (-),score=7.87 GHVT01061804.1:98-406(-)
MCDYIGVQLGIQDIVDFEKDQEERDEMKEWRRRSLRALKYAMDHIEAKPTTTKVHFSFHSNAVTQHVNMPLLRLVHQFVTMVENINQTRIELKHRGMDELYK